MKIKWIINNEVVKSIIIVMIGIIISFAMMVIGTICAFSQLAFWQTQIDFNSITEAKAIKFWREFKRSFAIFRFVIIPSVSIITGFVVGLLSSKRAWLLGAIVISPYVIVYFISIVTGGVSFNLLEIEMIFCLCLAPLFLCSLSSHLGYKLKIRVLNKIKRKRIITMKNLRHLLNLGIIGLSIFLANFAMAEENIISYTQFLDEVEKENIISYTQFLDEVESGKIKEIKIFCEKMIKGKYIDGNEFTTYIPYVDINLIEKIRKNNVVLWYGYSEKLVEKELREVFPYIKMIVWILLFSLIILGIFYFYEKRCGRNKQDILYKEKMLEKIDSLIEFLKEKK